MIEKLKTFIDSIKSVVLVIIGPLAFIAGFIYYLITKNTELKNELQTEKAGEKLNELQNAQITIDSNANSDVSNYEELKGRYEGIVSGSAAGLRQSSESTTIPDSNSRSGAVGSSVDAHEQSNPDSSSH